jgi:hypothetical protein
MRQDFTSATNLTQPSSFLRAWDQQRYVILARGRVNNNNDDDDDDNNNHKFSTGISMHLFSFMSCEGSSSKSLALV